MSRYQPIDLGFKKVYFRPDLSLWTEDDLKRIKKGKAPMGVDNNYLSWHHLERSNESPVVLVTQTFHTKYDKYLHRERPSDPKKWVNPQEWKYEKRFIWMSLSKIIESLIPKEIICLAPR